MSSALYFEGIKISNQTGNMFHGQEDLTGRRQKHSSDRRIFSWYKVLYELAPGPNAQFGTYAGSASIWVTNRRWVQQDGDAWRRRAIHVKPTYVEGIKISN